MMGNTQPVSGYPKLIPASAALEGFHKDSKDVDLTVIPHQLLRALGDQKISICHGLRFNQSCSYYGRRFNCGVCTLAVPSTPETLTKAYPLPPSGAFSFNDWRTLVEADSGKLLNQGAYLESRLLVCASGFLLWKRWDHNLTAAIGKLFGTKLEIGGYDKLEYCSQPVSGFKGVALALCEGGGGARLPLVGHEEINFFQVPKDDPAKLSPKRHGLYIITNERTEEGLANYMKTSFWKSVLSTNQIILLGNPDLRLGDLYDLELLAVAQSCANQVYEFLLADEEA